MQPLSPPLARRYKDVIAQFAAAEQAMQEEDKPLAKDEIVRAAVDFLVLYTEYAAAHRDADPTGEWQTFLVDFVHAFTYNDAEGVVHNALEDERVDDVVLDCCALDDEDTRTIAERLEALREALLEIKTGFDEMSLF